MANAIKKLQERRGKKNEELAEKEKLSRSNLIFSEVIGCLEVDLASLYDAIIDRKLQSLEDLSRNDAVVEDHLVGVMRNVFFDKLRHGELDPTVVKKISAYPVFAEFFQRYQNAYCEDQRKKIEEKQRNDNELRLLNEWEGGKGRSYLGEKAAEAYLNTRDCYE